MLHAAGFPGDDHAAREVAASFRGHPLLLQLAARSGLEPVGGAHRYLEESVWNTLSTAERTCLECACIFRGAVSMRTLVVFPGVTESALTSLQGKNILEPTLSGDVSVHDLVRKFVLGQVPGNRLRWLHETAADHFLVRPGPWQRLEGLYHLLQADSASVAADFLDTEGASLLDSVSVREVAALLREVKAETLDPAPACVFAEIRGDSLRIAGDLGPSLMQYRHAIRFCEAASRDERVPRILRKMASIERWRNRYPRALGLLVEADARLTRHPNPAEKAEILREMALVEQAQGNLTSAAAHLTEAVDLATEASDAGSLVRNLLALGTLEASRGHRERALQDKLEALRIAERAGNLTETARARIAVGTAFAELGRHRESLEYHDKGLELTRLVGNLRLTAYATMNRAVALLDLDRCAEAGIPLEEARRLLEILGEEDTLALLRVNEGQREMGLGHWARAKRLWGRGLTELRKLGSERDRALALKEVGRFHLAHGDVDGTRGYLLEARRIARKLGNVELLAEIDGYLPKHAKTAEEPNRILPAGSP